MTADITIVGLGPGPEELRTVAAQQALDNASHIFVRSHGDVELGSLLKGANVTDLAPFRNQQALNSANRWLQATEVVLEGARKQPVILAIPGHPRFGEGLVKQTLAMAEELGLTTRVIEGISATDMLASALNIDPILDQVQLVTGRALVIANDQSPFAGGLLQLTPRLPILITHVYNQPNLAAIQQQLLRIFPNNHPVELISAAGLEHESRSSTTVGSLEIQPGGQLLALFVPPMGALDATRVSTTLQHIVARLRRPDGCPWDIKQDNASIAQSLVDEVYEVIDAIEFNNDDNLAEELGDLMLLITMHAQIAEERGAFSLEDVYEGITTKIVRRHPHVFGEMVAEDADDVVEFWHMMKAQEKIDQPNKPEKAADGQPHSMPALTRAGRVLEKYPITVAESTAAQRQQALLDAVSAVVVAGDDPDEILKTALINHVSAANEDAEQGEKNASH